MFGSGVTTLIIANEETNDIMKTVKSLEESGLLITGVSQTIKNEAKERKERFLGMLLDSLGAGLLGNLLTSKGAMATSQRHKANTPGEGRIRAGESTVRAGQEF